MGCSFSLAIMIVLTCENNEGKKREIRKNDWGINLLR